MRHALGLGDAPGAAATARPQAPRQQVMADRRPRRFVRDGEVPVVMLATARAPEGRGPADRIAAVESALETERARSERAERALHEAQAAMQAMQTKLAHADMAHAEALAAERAQREVVEQTLATERAARLALEARLAEAAATAPAPAPNTEPPRARAERPRPGRPRLLRPAITVIEDDSPELALEPAPPRAAPARRPRVVASPTEPEQEPEPVKWWLPSFNAKRKRR